MTRLFALIGFLFFYLKEVVLSNLRVAYDVLTPTHHMTPGIIAIDVTGMTDRQILFMANLITMTPGTLGLAVSEDETTLYIHAMYMDMSVEAMAEDIESSYGRRIRRVF